MERKDEAHNMFTLGMLELEDKAKIETLFWEIGRGVLESYRGKAYVPEDIRQLKDQLGDQYLCNFSVFQSLLDHWALDQLFPIMPIHHLEETPACEGTLVDITCDSDGKVDQDSGVFQKYKKTIDGCKDMRPDWNAQAKRIHGIVDDKTKQGLEL